MSQIKTRKAVVLLSEVTVRALVAAIEEAKENTEFTDDPYPYCDMDTESAIEAHRKRGLILVDRPPYLAPPHSGVSFEIELNEVNGKTQESLGYQLHKRPRSDG